MAKSESPLPYAVEYSGLVLRRLRLLGRMAFSRGDGPEFAAALEEFHRRLVLYPQFGEPFLDLKTEPGQIYKGFVRPLGMRYAVYEDRRLVMVGALPILLPMRSDEAEAE
jgi:hypothetical protein